MDVAGKCAIVTGGSSGIGKAIAKLLARRGANVFLIARREEPLKAAVKEMEKETSGDTGKFGCFPADVGDRAAVEKAIKAAEEKVWTRCRPC